MIDLLKTRWDDIANIPTQDGVFDDSLSSEEWMELRSYAEDCLDTEGY